MDLEFRRHALAGHGGRNYALAMARILTTLLLTLGLFACRAGGAANVSADTPYYASYGIRLDRQACRSTNYRGGHTSSLLPINTEVRRLSARGHRVQMQIVNGPRFTFEHVARHTMDSLEEAFGKAFSTEPVDLSAFSPEEQEAIARGEATVGMSREAVLAAIGPPPATGTVTLDSDEWKYWSTRFTTFFVRFGDDGRVTYIGR